jgi:hypothetical protein
MPVPASSQHYRELAREARQLAKGTIPAAAKTDLLKRAEHYDLLAEEIAYWGQLAGRPEHSFAES